MTEHTEEEIHKNVVRYMDYNISPVKRDNFQEFTSDALKSSRLGILLIYTENIPLELFSLGSNPEIKRKVMFGILSLDSSNEIR